MNRSTASTRATLSAADVERLVLWGIALIVCLLCCGLLVGALALPLHWLPGEMPLLLLLLCIMPATGVVSTRRTSQLTGLAATSFMRRAQATQLAVQALCLVVVPAYEWRRLEQGRDWLGLTFLAPVAVSVALSLLAAGLAGRLARTWYLLQPQPWEVKELGGPTGAWSEPEGTRSVDRTPIIHDLWRGWCIGGIAIALAVLLNERFAATGEWYALVGGLLAFVAYSALGPLLIGRAVQARWATQWRIDRLTIPPEVGANWGRRATVLTISTLLAMGLLLALRLLDLAHAVLIWLLLTVILPPLDALLAWLSRHFGGNPPQLRRFFQQQEQQRHPVHPIVMGPPGHHSSNAFWAWLGHAWPIILGVLAVAILAWSIRQAGRAAGGPDRWRAAVAAILAELRALLRLLWQPSRQMLADTMAALQREADKVHGIRTRRRTPPHDLPPRQAVIAFYLAALDLAARRGRPRRAGQTPHEYLTTVSVALPESQETLSAMTDIFVSVRYGTEPADGQHTTRMRAFWATLRARLRRHLGR